MKKLIFQSDDYGLTDSVTDGILKGIRQGIIRNTGLFVNMPSSKRAAMLIRDIEGIAVGIDINLVAGYPVTDSHLVSALVDETGHFITSKSRIKDNKIIGREGMCLLFEEDPYDYEQTLLETENQVKEFIDLMGRKPAYIHPHSLMTPNTEKAQREVAKKYNIPMTINIMKNEKIGMIPSTWTPKPFPIEEQMKTDVTFHFLKSLEESKDIEVGYFICHCGFVEEDLMKETEYTLIRIKDLAMATSSEVKKYLEKNKIVLINITDILI